MKKSLFLNFFLILLTFTLIFELNYLLRKYRVLAGVLTNPNKELLLFQNLTYLTIGGILLGLITLLILQNKKS